MRYNSSVKYKTEAEKLPGIMTIRCWACGKLIERHPCSKQSNGATLHELCPPCDVRLETGFRGKR